MLLLFSLEICFTWAVIALTLIGIGSIVLARFGADYSLFDAFWMGLAASVALLEIWNLLLPITSSTTALLFCVGLLGLLANRSVIFSRLKTTLQSSPMLNLLAVAIVLFIAFRSAGPCDYFDTGLYGAPAVRWIQTYPAVPGLANLNGRLGFNSSVFLFIAALQQGVWRGLAHHLFTGFMMAALCVTILPACLRVAAKFSASPADWFHSILAIPAISWATRSPIVGTQTDEPAAIVCLVATGILFENFSQSNEESQAGPALSRLLVAATLFSLAVSFKLSTIVFALLAWCLAFRRIWLLGRSSQKRTTYLVGTLALSTLILLPWCVRGIILTGYPFFPAAILGFPVDWKVPLSAAKWYVAAVKSWGRMPDTSVAYFLGRAWIGEWLNHAIRNRVAFQVPLGISLAGLAAALSGLIRSRPRPLYPWLWLLLPALAGTVFWFLASPDMRFGQFAIWTTAGTLGTWGIVSVTSERPAVYSRMAFAMILLSLAWCLISFGWTPPYRALLAVKELPPLPKPGLIVRHTSSGLAVYVPAQGYQCWDAPLPCTPYFDDSLRLRDESSLRWGFTSEGRAAEIQLPPALLQ
jgi:hypothetical protein